MELFTCPLCAEPLSCTDRVLSCPANHCFDLAREGYVNLLPSHHRGSLAPGDTTEMISARTDFLNSGHYEQLVTALRSVLSGMQGSLVDLGCGEGYFTSSIAEVVPNVYGVDISRPAIKAASKRSKSINLAVASTARLPMADKTFELATTIMAPSTDDLHRILKDGGRFIRVTPGPDHLIELKEVLYTDSRAHKRASTDLSDFKLLKTERTTGSTELDPDRIADLIAMTPMQFRTSRERQIKAGELGTQSFTLDFWIDIFEKDIKVSADPPTRKSLEKD